MTFVGAGVLHVRYRLLQLHRVVDDKEVRAAPGQDTADQGRQAEAGFARDNFLR